MPTATQKKETQTQKNLMKLITRKKGAKKTEPKKNVRKVFCYFKVH